MSKCCWLKIVRYVDMTREFLALSGGYELDSVSRVDDFGTKSPKNNTTCSYWITTCPTATG